MNSMRLYSWIGLAVVAVALVRSPLAAGAEPAPILMDAHGDPLPNGARFRLGGLRFRSSAEIKTLAYSPDGRLLALASTDNRIRLWEANTGKEIQQLIGHDAAVTSLAFAADGKTLASGSYDGTVRLWEVVTGKLLQKLSANNSWVTAVAFAPDGKTIAAGGRHRALQAWQADTGQELWKVQRPLWVTALLFSRDGRTLVSTSKYDGLRTWDAASGDERAKLEGHQGHVHALALAPDGQTLASAGSDRTVRLWELATAKEQRTLEGHLGTIYALAFSLDGQMLSSGSADGTIRLWEPATGKERAVLPTGRGEVVALALHPDGRTAASANLQSQLVQLWDIRTGKVKSAAAGHSSRVTALAFSADEAALATGGKDCTLRLWDLRAGSERFSVPADESPLSTIAFAPDGRALATASQRRGARLWESATGKPLASWRGDDWVVGFTFGSDGQPFAWTTGEVRDDPRRANVYNLQGIHRVDLLSGQRVQTWKPDMTQIPARPAGPALQLSELPGHFAPIVAVSASSRRRDLLATGCQDKTVGLWRLQSGHYLGRLDAHEGQVTSVAFAADDRALVSTDSRTIRVWEVGTHRPVHTITLPAGEVLAVALAPTGRYLAWAGSAEPSIHLVDLTAAQKDRTVPGHAGEVTALAFSERGQWLASGSADTTTLVWDAKALTNAVLEPRAALAAKDLEQIWADLASTEDVPRAYARMGELLRVPEQAVAWFQTLLTEKPKGPPIAQSIAELDSPNFPTREAATKTLENLGELARPDLLKALDARPSLEVRQRLDILLRQLDRRQGRPSPNELRQIRAIQVLEWLDTPAARALLAELAKGPATSWQTPEAQAALQRLLPSRRP